MYNIGKLIRRFLGFSASPDSGIARMHHLFHKPEQDISNFFESMQEAMLEIYKSCLSEKAGRDPICMLVAYEQERWQSFLALLYLQPEGMYSSPESLLGIEPRVSHAGDSVLYTTPVVDRQDIQTGIYVLEREVLRDALTELESAPPLFFEQVEEKGDDTEVTTVVFGPTGMGVRKLVIAPDKKAAQAAVIQEKAESGNAEAILDLGYRYARGDGVPQDDSQAVKLFRQAAELGNAEAMSSLSHFYMQGFGVDENPNEEFYWLKMAAEHGSTIDMQNLSMYYLHGGEDGYKGTLKDLVRALAWRIILREYEDMSHDSDEQEFIKCEAKLKPHQLEEASKIVNEIRHTIKRNQS